MTVLPRTTMNKEESSWLGGKGARRMGAISIIILFVVRVTLNQYSMTILLKTEQREYESTGYLHSDHGLYIINWNQKKSYNRSTTTYEKLWIDLSEPCSLCVQQNAIGRYFSVIDLLYLKMFATKGILKMKHKELIFFNSHVGNSRSDVVHVWFVKPNSRTLGSFLSIPAYSK